MATLLLVHGGFCGGWYWHKVKTILELAGHIVYAPTLTGLGQYDHLNNPQINLDTHIQDISNLLFFEDVKKVILVGHSYGGLVITGAASRNPSQIDQLIYLDGLIAENGESLND
jgi:pimeloyl-ACP methyl ester carboxylesterase